ncbi:hypothetical protein Tco_0942729 [Tanacetum coccineum]
MTHDRGEYEIYNKSWKRIVDTLKLEAGMILVFTIKQHNKLHLMAFNLDGSPFTDVKFYGITFWQPNEPRLALEELSDNRMHHVCQWESHRDHFGEALNTFYMSLSRQTL